ncbi:hypothetical protein BS17DRAFT_481690 [Gyrodon lividus]|nr:hypothetical protein BS17DRAFT_481690 [Gyrodon lividus]
MPPPHTYARSSNDRCKLITYAHLLFADYGYMQNISLFMSCYFFPSLVAHVGPWLQFFGHYNPSQHLTPASSHLHIRSCSVTYHLSSRASILLRGTPLVQGVCPGRSMTTRSVGPSPATRRPPRPPLTGWREPKHWSSMDRLIRAVLLGCC